MAIAVDVLAVLGLAVLLAAVTRGIAKWVYWHNRVSADISALQSMEKWHDDRVMLAHARISELAQKLKVELKS